MPTVETLKPGEFGRDDLEQLARLHLEVFDAKGRTVTQYAEHLAREWSDPSVNPKAQRHLIREEGQIIANANSMSRTVQTESGPIEVLALAGVCSDPGSRGRGLGRAVVRQAFDRVDAGEFAWALFQTGVPGFYEKLGCVAVQNRFVNGRGEDAQADPWWDPHRMVYQAPGVERQVWPAGTVDLGGPGW